MASCSAGAGNSKARPRPRASSGPSPRSMLAAVDAWQRRHRAVAFAVAVAKKFTEDGASRLAALTAYYAFVSLFPLLLALVSILGFLLEGNPSLQADVLDSALARIPVIGVRVSGGGRPLTG